MVRLFRAVILLSLLVAVSCYADLYDFDFYSSEVILSWEATASQDYLIELYEVRYDECNNITPIFLRDYLVTNYLVGEEVRVGAIKGGKLRIHIYEFIDGAKAQLVSSRDFSFNVAPEAYTMTWCPVSYPDEFSYRIYTKSEASYDYYDYIDIDSDQTTHRYEYLPIFEKIFRVITARSVETELESDYSNEVLLFIALPSDLKELYLAQ